MNLTVSQKLQIAIVSDTTLQIILEKLPLVEFWCYIKEHPQQSEKAMKNSYFPTTYLCKARFSAYDSIKSIYFTRLNAETNLRKQLPSIKPDIKDFHKSKIKPFLALHFLF